MAKSVKGTQTEKNLLTSFAGESQARMRYTYFASTAKKEGYEQIAAIFTETADQEKEHAKRMFKWLEGGMVEITASYPAGIIGTTMENLNAQDCSVSYGNNLSIFNVTHLSIDKYEETLVATNFFPKYKFKHGGHHFSHIEYKGQNIIAFDKKSREYAITPLFSSLYALICRLMKITSHK